MRLLSRTAIPLGIQVFFIFIIPVLLYGITFLAILLGLVFVSLFLLTQFFFNVSTAISKKAIAAKGLKPLILNGIAASHFTEKVRWCLDLIGDPYTEELDMGVLGIFLLGRSVPRITLPVQNTCIGDSVEILRYLAGRYGNTEKGQFFALDKPDIYNQIFTFEEKCNKMAVCMQIYVYHYRLDDATLSNNFWGANEPAVPYWQKVMSKLLFPLIKKFLLFGLKITQAKADQSYDTIEQTFADVEKMMTDNRKYILGTDEFTLADVVFAALAGPLVRHPKFSGGRQTYKDLPLNKEVEAGIQNLTTRYPKAVAHVNMMYDKHRPLSK